MIETKEFINTLNKDKKVILACSGGPDSMFLLNLLIENNFDVVVAHVNHKMRQESDDEYIFLEKYCQEKKVIFAGIEYNKGNVKNFQNDARIFRYNFFKTLVLKYKASYLFTAHHGDDLTETILMRLVRGSSLNGYTGFHLITNKDNYQIVRPLLYMTKKEIEEYDKLNNIPYVIDNSNNTNHYTRNRYRHNILPFLKEEYSNVHLKFLEFSNQLDKQNNYVNKIVDNHLKTMYNNNNNILDLSLFNKEDIYIQKCIIQKIINKMYPNNLYDITYSNILEIMKAINSNKPNIEVLLPNNKVAIKAYNNMIFTNKVNKCLNNEIILKDVIETDDYKIYITNKDDDKSNNCIRLNSKTITKPLKIRTRLVNDRIYVKNLNGSKKVNDIFIDSKIPKDKRDTYPLLVDQTNEILWIPGIKKSKKDVPIGQCYDIIIEYEKKEKSR